MQGPNPIDFDNIWTVVLKIRGHSFLGKSDNIGSWFLYFWNFPFLYIIFLNSFEIYLY